MSKIKDYPKTNTTKPPKILSYVLTKVSTVPELEQTIKLIRSNGKISSNFTDNVLDYASIVFFDYLSVIRSLLTLSKADLQLVKVVNQKRKELGMDTNPLGHHGIDHLYRQLTKDDRDRYWQTLVTNLNENSPIFRSAVSDLAKRMNLASQLALKGEVLQDGDPRADKVIWGHTKGLGIEATIHFVICHLIDRLSYQILRSFGDDKLTEMTMSKHYLFDPFGDIIFLLNTKKMVNPEISTRWALTREKGGLNWNTKREQKVFDEEYEKLVKSK